MWMVAVIGANLATAPRPLGGSSTCSLLLKKRKRRQQKAVVSVGGMRRDGSAESVGCSLFFPSDLSLLVTPT